MKSIVKIILFLYLFAFTYSTKTTTMSKKTMMEFYGELFSNNNNQNQITSNAEIEKEDTNEVSRLSSKKKINNFLKKSRENEENSALNELNESANESESNTEVALTAQKETFLYTGWQQISSKLFDNENIFPRVNVLTPTGTFTPERIKIDNEFFRINSKTNPAPQTKYDFYFKMNNDKFYYSTDAADVNILQVFLFETYNNVEELPIKFFKDRTSISCFDVIEKTTKFRYKICDKNRTENLKLMCMLGKKLNLYLDSCKKDDKEDGIDINTVVTKEIIDATIVIPQASKTCNEGWTYNNHGDDWEGLCKEGTVQSPIDLPSLDKVIYSPIQPLFQFEIVPAKSPVTTIDGDVQENGNIKINYMNGAIRVLHPNLGKIVTLNGAVYIAEEISVHTPSEHTKEGKRFDMEIQITFYGQSKGDIAKQVSLSFLFEKKAGYYNKFIDDLDFYTLPNSKEPEKFILNDLFIPRIFYSVTGENDPDELITMKPFNFYTYDGSLTMPPCSEDTIHYVAAEPIPIGSVVLDLAIEALKMPDMKKDDSTGQSTTIIDNSTPENYRNIQENNHREVFYFDHDKYCDPEIESYVKPTQFNGHYEKFPRKVITHIFVPGTQSSGIPGSFVESKKEAYGITDQNKP